MKNKKFGAFRKMPMYTDYLMLGIICILLVCQIAFSSVFLNNQKLENYYNSSEKILQKLVLNDENVMENLSRLSATASQDEDVVKMLYGQQLSENQMTSLYVRMRSYVGVSQSVKGILLYSKSQDKVFDVLRPFSAPNSYISNSLRDNINGPSMNRKSFVIFNNDVEGYNNAMFMYVTFFDNKREDAIAIYMDYDMFKLSYGSYQSDVNGQLIVTGGDGNVIYGGGTYLPGSSVAEEKFFYNKVKSADYGYVNFEGVKSLVFAEYSAYSDRWYFSVTPVKNIRNINVFSAQNAFVLTGIIITLFVIIRWLIWFKKLRISVKDLRPQQVQHREEKKLDKNTKQLFDYMNKPEFSGVENINNILPIGVNPNFPAACLIIKIDNFKEFKAKCSPMDIDLYTYGMRNIFEELVSEHNVLPWYVNRFEDRMEYLIFNVSDKYFEQTFNEIAQMCIARFHDYISIDASFFLSHADACRNINKLYAEANDISEYSFYFGSGIVLDSSVMRDDAEFNAKEYYEAIKDSLLVGRCDEWEYLERFTHEMINMSAKQIRDSMLELLLCIHSAAETLQKNGVIETSFDIVKNLSAYEQAEYLTDVTGLIKNMFDDIERQRNAMKEQKLDLLAQKCISIIEKEYADPSFCLDSLAAVVGLSANYLGRKFRQTTGVSIADKITEYRLLEAERLMVNTDKSLKTIMADVGFTNNSYFTVSFRKRYGVAPSVYRRNNRN